MKPPIAVNSKISTTTERNNPTSATLLTTFGVGRSYLFNVAANASRKPEECWHELFAERKGWDFKQLQHFDKPLGETATFTFSKETLSDTKVMIKNLQDTCARLLFAVLNSIEVHFFTTGIAILLLRVTPKDPDVQLEFLDRVQNAPQLKQFRTSLRQVFSFSMQEYFAVLDKAESDKRSATERGWSLKRFKEVDREDWKPKSEHSYPLFFVTDEIYDERTESILGQVCSDVRRKQQSDCAKVSYQNAEIYVDWSEALIKKCQGSQRHIEANFIIAFASWFAMVLMNKNSSIFLFAAFVDMVENKHRSNATAVHQRNMAYKDVSDASLPIRWTTRRKDLFLLETIHQNWSSERWRSNIEERMKLLALHYKSLEDEKNDNSNRKLTRVAILLALTTLASAIVDVITLAENNGQQSHSFLLGLPLKFYISLVPALLAVVLAVWWTWRVLAVKVVRRWKEWRVDRASSNKDKFEKKGYEYIEKHFEKSLAGLENPKSGIEAKFSRIDATQFIASVCVNDKLSSSCVIRRRSRGEEVGGIAFACGNSIESSMSELLLVQKDTEALYLKPLGISGDRSLKLTLEDAADLYWKMFVRNLIANTRSL